MRLEIFTDRQLKGMLEVTAGSVIDLDEESTPDFDLAFSLAGQLKVATRFMSRIDKELNRRELKISGARAVGDARNNHMWSEKLLDEVEQLRRDFIFAPVPGEKK